MDFLDVRENKIPKEGAYQSYTFGRKPQINVILLDSRYFRDKPKKQGKDYVANKRGTILGSEQWKWLEKELKNSKADIHLIGNGIQVIPEEHAYEKWANFPWEKKKLFELLESNDVQNPILLSSDRHTAEISRIELGDYAIHEVTASGLTHSSNSLKGEANKRRLGPLMKQKNFGFI